MHCDSLLAVRNGFLLLYTTTAFPKVCSANDSYDFSNFILFDNILNLLNTYNYYQVIRKKLILNYITKMTFSNYYFTLLKQIDLLGCSKSNPLFHSTKFTDNL